MSAPTKASLGSESALPAARVAHDACGRVRLRVDAKRGDSEFFDRVASDLREASGVASVEANPFTGSLLVCHAGGASAVAEIARRKKLFAVAPAQTKDSRTGGVSGSVDGRAITALALVGLAAYQVSRGNLLAPASTLLSDAVKLLPFGRR